MGFWADRIKQFSNFERGWNDLMTYARQGLRELRSVFYPESLHARETDPAMWGNKLPMEVYQDRHAADGPSPTFEKSDDSLRALEKQFEPSIAAQVEPERHTPEMERD